MREFLHVGPSDKIVYRFDGKRVFIESVSASTEALYGSLKSDRKPPSREELSKARAAYYIEKRGK